MCVALLNGRLAVFWFKRFSGPTDRRSSVVVGGCWLVVCCVLLIDVWGSFRPGTAKLVLVLVLPGSSTIVTIQCGVCSLPTFTTRTCWRWHMCNRVSISRILDSYDSNDSYINVYIVQIIQWYIYHHLPTLQSPHQIHPHPAQPASSPYPWPFSSVSSVCSTSSSSP